ncbi:pectinesterase-like [Vigna radiata var. radiata]|uniref:Pectinesterase-like n=1 Tax=Vigna radiata var. radiata TaxID=3916 RepID=A0A3Q0FDI2_VIGRR|nr:pectinesterase-like [Vigna radiata var. radiata]
MLGTVDFIFSDMAQVVLQNCDIQVIIPLTSQQNVITAQGRTNNEDGGIVIQNCRIGTTHEFEGVKKKFQTYLERPCKNYSRTIIMESYMRDIIDSAGWLEWEGTTSGLNTLFYREYNFGLGAQTSNRVTWKGFKVITHSAEVEPFTVRNFINDSQWLNSTGFPYKLDL